jgi:DNA-binding transcriptional MerR regulator
VKKQKFFYRIGEVSRILGVKPHVIRYWEQEFQLKPQRKEGSHRRYTVEEIKRLEWIKSLLYEQGYTIAGAKKKIGSLSADQSDYRALIKKILEELCEIKHILETS